MLREWRQRRNLPQLDLAHLADTSARHVSFVETGRSRPSRALLSRLADHLDVPVRHRNALYVAAGYAPAFERSRLDSPRLRLVNQTIERLFEAYEPFPALALDADEDIVSMNRGAALLARDLPARLLEPPVNLMRVALHPDGLARQIVNLAEWREHMLGRLYRQMIHSGLPSLRSLYQEVSGYADTHVGTGAVVDDSVLTQLHMRLFDTEIRLFSTITTFGATTDMTVAELSLETFHPADDHTAKVFRKALEARTEPARPAG
ncbi:helix-turn-helix domain-containing protein [Longispora fulva]|uniref:helix-turn-helix domain-containing protein n=1 Tax=Longispora fulva TaxID=619741 RepID=UPI0022785F8B|nr:helix-turn-helix domain-containing protein [Longispora fulva]